MGRLFGTGVACIASWIFFASVSYATTVNTFMIVSGVYQPAGGANPGVLIGTTPAIIDQSISSGQPFIYKVDIMTQISGLAPGEVFGLQDFSLITGSTQGSGVQIPTSGAGLIRAVGAPGAANSKNGYVSNNPFITGFANDGVNPIGQQFTFNADTGIRNDLLSIQIFTKQFQVGAVYDENLDNLPDPRLSFGIGQPALLGSVFVQWDGVTQAWLNMVSLFGTPNSPPTYYPLRYQLNNDGPPPSSTALFDMNMQSLPTVGVLFRTLPEPASWTMMSLAGVALIFVARRRRSEFRETHIIDS